MVQSNGSCRGGVISNLGVEPSSLVCRLGQNIVSLNLRTFNMLFNSSMTKQRSTLIISRCLCVLVGGRESAWHLELFIKRHWSAVYYYFYSLNTLERVKVMIDDKIKHFFYCFKCVWCCCLILRPRQLRVSMLCSNSEHLTMLPCLEFGAAASRWSAMLWIGKLQTKVWVQRAEPLEKKLRFMLKTNRGAESTHV